MSHTTPAQSAATGSSLRRKFLFGLLGILLIALAYDYAVARPGVETAYDQIAERSIEVNANSTQVFTNTDVHQLIGKDPARTFQDPNGDTVEVFRWLSGLPIRSHELFAVYKPNGGKLLFHRHAKFKYETSEEVGNLSSARMVAKPEDYASVDASGMVESGTDGGPGGGGPGGGGPGGGGGFDPETRFTEQDADSDGFWKGDEIPERTHQSLTEVDTDGDGAVSKAEWMARVEAMRAQFGGGGGGGPSGGSETVERNRPEPEEAPAPSEGAEKTPAAPEAAPPAAGEAPTETSEPN
jgi:hypothetical protein